MPDRDARDWPAVVRAHLGPLPMDPARALDVVRELAEHVAEHHADLVASGMTDDAALAAALRPLRERARLAEEIARADRPRPAAPTPPPARGTTLADDLARDVRYAVRVLARSRAFAAAAIATLAIGIGANTAIFTVLNAVLLQPLPFSDPARLVLVGRPENDGSASNVGYISYLEWRERSRAFDELALIRSWATTLMTAGEPERISGMRVTANFFRMLGVRPA